ncbi:MAG TPA: zf-TFIIB domain-containing protein [Candidatus Acidoferrales bacterium]|nr:zf-TFIIB domain-containing protein [Candidatus Acidoferrales bacterium]
MATSEKDRFGDKLRDAERAREDQYFADQDRKLVEKMRQTGDEAKHAAGSGRCPKCGTSLRPLTLNAVSVDECPDCRGVWLDRGELEAIAKHEDEGWIARWLRLEFEKKA